MADAPKLTEKQERFCLEWIVDCNGKKAAIRAGYMPKSAESQASRLLRNAKVRKRIRQLQKGRANRLQITADKVMNEYAKLAFSDIANVASWTPKGVEFIPSKHVKKSARATIAEISSETKTRTAEDGAQESTTTLKVKLHPKLPALDKLALHLGITPDNDEDETEDSEFADGLAEMARIAERLTAPSPESPDSDSAVPLPGPLRRKPRRPS
jgi:phage terminase small subunit